MNNIEAKHELIRIAREATGVHLRPPYDTMKGLADRVHAVGADNYIDYLDYVRCNPPELELLCEAMVITITHWFRDNSLWGHFREDLIHRVDDLGADFVNIWSAGCSRGEEAYSVAIVANETVVRKYNKDFAVMASDYANRNLDVARAGVYGATALRSKMRKEIQDRYFISESRKSIVVSELRDKVSFHKINLLEDLDIDTKFDFVFCRNVLAYFDEQTIAKVLDAIVDCMAPNAMLYIGRSDTRIVKHPCLTLVQKTKGMAFQKGECP